MGDVTPLLHAMRIGHQDVAIILLGAFSRYINYLQDDEMALPRTKTRLKALRKNSSRTYGDRADVFYRREPQARDRLWSSEITE